MFQFFAKMVFVGALFVSTGCAYNTKTGQWGSGGPNNVASYHPWGPHAGGYRIQAQINGQPCNPGDEWCIYYYRMNLFEQCERALAQNRIWETGASVALPIVAGIIQGSTRNEFGYSDVYINQYVQRSYDQCDRPPMPAREVFYGRHQHP